MNVQKKTFVTATAHEGAGRTTIAIQGFQKVKASIMWAASVLTTANITQATFLPVLSTTKPRTGDAGAEMMYTMLGETGNSMKGERYRDTALKAAAQDAWLSCLQVDWSQWRITPDLSYLLTALASAGEKLNFSMKNTLQIKREDDRLAVLLALYIDVTPRGGEIELAPAAGTVALTLPAIVFYPICITTIYSGSSAPQWKHRVSC